MTALSADCQAVPLPEEGVSMCTPTHCMLRLNRRDISGIDTIEVDIWTTLVPPNGVTAATVWLGSAPPNTRVFQRTAEFDVPFNITLLNATTYLVRAGRQ